MNTGFTTPTAAFVRTRCTSRRTNVEVTLVLRARSHLHTPATPRHSLSTVPPGAPKPLLTNPDPVHASPALSALPVLHQRVRRARPHAPHDDARPRRHRRRPGGQRARDHRRPADARPDAAAP